MLPRIHPDRSHVAFDDRLSRVQLPALPQIKCYRSSLQSSLLADPATKPEIALHRLRKGSLQHVGGPNCAYSLPLSASY